LLCVEVLAWGFIVFADGYENGGRLNIHTVGYDPFITSQLASTKLT